MLQGAKDVCLAAADDVTRQRCMRIIQAASAASSLQDIALAAALTPGLGDMKSVAAVKAVFAALGCDWSAIRTGGFTAAEARAAGYDAAVFRAAGCSWADVKTAGFTAAEARAAGCDVKSAQAAGYDLPSLVAAFGYDACKAAGCNVSRILVSCSAASAEHSLPPPNSLSKHVVSHTITTLSLSLSLPPPPAPYHFPTPTLSPSPPSPPSPHFSATAPTCT